MIRSVGEKNSRGTVGFSIHGSAGESGHVTDTLKLPYGSANRPNQDLI